MSMWSVFSYHFYSHTRAIRPRRFSYFLYSLCMARLSSKQANLWISIVHSFAFILVPQRGSANTPLPNVVDLCAKPFIHQNWLTVERRWEWKEIQLPHRIGVSSFLTYWTVWHKNRYIMSRLGFEPRRDNTSNRYREKEHILLEITIQLWRSELMSFFRPIVI